MSVISTNSTRYCACAQQNNCANDNRRTTLTCFILLIERTHKNSGTLTGNCRPAHSMNAPPIIIVKIAHLTAHAHSQRWHNFGSAYMIQRRAISWKWSGTDLIKFNIRLFKPELSIIIILTLFFNFCKDSEILCRIVLKGHA